MVTRTRIIQIGNSKGIRVPKMLLEQAQLPDEVELQAERGRLIVRPARGARAGWADAARAMRARGDDQLLDEPTSSEFDGKEWRWR
jgi:antitoxin MazE